ncbi:hypothetical protein Tco_0460152, partial [Tanacetum coccineum]
VLKEKEDVVIAVMDEEYHNYGIDPISEEDDVANEDGGMADEMRPEYEFDPCQKQGGMADEMRPEYEFVHG